MATHSSIVAWRTPGMGAWRAAVHGVAKNWTQLKQLSVLGEGRTDGWTGDQVRGEAETPEVPAGAEAAMPRM